MELYDPRQITSPQALLYWMYYVKYIYISKHCPSKPGLHRKFMVGTYAGVHIWQGLHTLMCPSLLGMFVNRISLLKNTACIFLVSIKWTNG